MKVTEILEGIQHLSDSELLLVIETAFELRKAKAAQRAVITKALLKPGTHVRLMNMRNHKDFRGAVIIEVKKTRAEASLEKVFPENTFEHYSIPIKCCEIIEDAKPADICPKCHKGVIRSFPTPRGDERRCDSKYCNYEEKNDAGNK